MSMQDDLEEIERVIEAGERLAERNIPPDPGAWENPIKDLGTKLLFTQWRGTALRFVQLQTGANSEYARDFSAHCGAEGSYSDMVAGLAQLQRVRQGILDGLFERKGLGLFLWAE